MKKIYVLAMVLLVAAVVALPGAAHSAMWVGGELGLNILGNSDLDLKANAPGFAASATASSVKFDNPEVLGGLTIGYDFVKEGFGGYDWPDWMKYFSFATDFTYNRNSIHSQSLNLNNINVNGVAINSGPINTFINQNRTTFLPGVRLDGYTAAWTFLFMGHYGFFPDSEVPSGRVNPYIGVGPAILWSGLNAGKAGFGSASATNVALVVEGGVRFMALRNVSIDVGFRYRYANPEYSFSSSNPLGLGVPASASVSTTINSYTVLTRVSYHF